MSLLDTITGGENQQAAAALQQALAAIQGVQTPTADQLKLSPLAQYTSTGNLNPALADAAQAGPSAYTSENLSSVPISTMQDVLAREKHIAEAQGMTPQEQAAIADAEQSVNENTAGQRGAIAQDFAGRGIPQSLIAAALENGTVGQNAQQAHKDALDARANAANQGLAATANEGNLASTMYGQEAGQANAVAAAQDALKQFNAQNVQQTNLANQGVRQAANTYNTSNAQNISNQNVTGQHQVQEQNQVEAPQEAAALALQKAGAEANVGNNQAQQHTQAGQQAAGLFGGLLGAGATVGASAMAPSTVVLAADGGEIPDPQVPPINFLRGGPVPGHAMVPGNSPKNDTVPARLSPGEFVVPRTAMARPGVREFLAQNVPTPRPPAPHPSDVASVMRALAELRGGNA